MTRALMFGTAFLLTAGVAQAQPGSPWLAARQCLIEPTEGPELREAFGEFVEYAQSNTPDLPGEVYGSFRQRVWGAAHFTTVFEVASVAEYDELVRARNELIQSDQTWGNLWRAWNSHLVPQSCQTAFHQRWP